MRDGVSGATLSYISYTGWFAGFVPAFRGYPRRMAQCEVCGNDYDMAFEVHAQGAVHVFDSFECAIHRMAPVCEHCGCKIVDRKSTRLNSSHANISYAVFCLKKKNSLNESVSQDHVIRSGGP